MKTTFRAVVTVLMFVMVSGGMAVESPGRSKSTVGLCITGREVPAKKSGSLVEKAFSDRMGWDARHVAFSSVTDDDAAADAETRIWTCLNQSRQDNVIVYVNGSAEQEGADIRLLDVFKQPTMLSSFLSEIVERLNGTFSSCTLVLDLSTSRPIIDENGLLTKLVDGIKNGAEPLPLLLIMNTRPDMGPAEPVTPSWLASALVDGLSHEALQGRRSPDGTPVPLSFTDLQLHLEEKSVAEKERVPAHRSPTILNLMEVADSGKAVAGESVVGEIRIRTLEEVIGDHARQCAEKLGTQGIQHIVLPDFSGFSTAGPSKKDLQGNSLDRYLRDLFITEFNRNSPHPCVFIDPLRTRITFKKHNFNGELQQLSRDSLDKLLGDLREAGSVLPDQSIAMFLCSVLPAPPVAVEGPGSPSSLIARIQVCVVMELVTKDAKKEQRVEQDGGDGWMTPEQFSQREEVSYVPPRIPVMPPIESVPAVPREASDLIDPVVRKEEAGVVDAMLAQQHDPHPLTSKTARFGIRIRLMKRGVEVADRECPMRFVGGGSKAFVELKSGDIYQIEIENNTKYLAFLRLLVDGQNTLPEPVICSDGQPKKDEWGREVVLQHQRVSPNRARYWAIPPGKRTVSGFYSFIDPTGKRDSEYNGFQVVSAEDSVAGMSGNVEDAGTISAYFYDAVEAGQEQRMSMSANGRLGTALGEQKQIRLSVYDGQLVPADAPAAYLHIGYGSGAR
jgi:hypothetical protein